MDWFVACYSLLEGTMTLNRTKVWDPNYVTVITSAATKFLERVADLADEHPYLATSLPDLLLEAGRFDALTALALEQGDSPGASQLLNDAADLERYEIRQHTVQLALKGALRQGFEHQPLAL